MDRVRRLYLEALRLKPDHLKAYVAVDGEEKELPFVEIRSLLDAGKIKYDDIGDIVHDNGNDLKDLDAWLGILKDRAFSDITCKNEIKKTVEAMAIHEEP